ALDHAHLAPDQVDLDAALDLAPDAAVVGQLVADLDAVAVHDDRLVLVRVDAGARDDDARRVRQPHDAVGRGDDLLRGVDRADDLLAGAHLGAVAHQHVHGGVHLVLLAALPLDLERDRDARALGLGGAQLGGGGGRQPQGRAGLRRGQLVALLDELAAGDARLHAGGHQVGGQLLLGVDVADDDDAAVVADRQQLDDALGLGGDDDVLGQLGDRLAALVALVLLDEVLLGDDEPGVARLLVVEPDATREAVLRDAGDLRLHALGELLAGLDPLAVGDDGV